MNYDEQNRNTLQEALSRLPQYRPPDELWGQIESELSRKETLGRLPSYSPPPAVWEAIETGLEKEKETAPPRFRLRRLAWPAAAASIAALVAWFMFYPPGDAGPQAVYTYETGKANLELLANDWDADDESLKTVVEQFSRDPIAQRKEQYAEILEDWKELQEAKAEIKEVMELYGKDARLVRQMSEIERERSKLARAMAMAI